jgi:hypothetical protein
VRLLGLDPEVDADRLPTLGDRNAALWAYPPFDTATP